LFYTLAVTNNITG